MDVAVGDLKAKLSAYLRRAAAGEVITVTDRDRPIAVLGPLLSGADLSQAIEQGWITPPDAAAARLRPRVRHGSARSVGQVLTEDRDE